MGWRVTWQCKWEGCGALSTPRPTSGGAGDQAWQDGWLFGRCFGMPAHLCPSCKDKPPAGPEWEWPGLEPGKAGGA